MSSSPTHTAESWFAGALPQPDVYKTFSSDVAELLPGAIARPPDFASGSGYDTRAALWLPTEAAAPGLAVAERALDLRAPYRCPSLYDEVMDGATLLSDTRATDLHNYLGFATDYEDPRGRERWYVTLSHPDSVSRRLADLPLGEAHRPPRFSAHQVSELHDEQLARIIARDGTLPIAVGDLLVDEWYGRALPALVYLRPADVEHLRARMRRALDVGTVAVEEAAQTFGANASYDGLGLITDALNNEGTEVTPEGVRTDGVDDPTWQEIADCLCELIQPARSDSAYGGLLEVGRGLRDHVHVLLRAAAMQRARTARAQRS